MASPSSKSSSVGDGRVVLVQADEALAQQLRDAGLPVTEDADAPAPGEEDGRVWVLGPGVADPPGQAQRRCLDDQHGEVVVVVAPDRQPDVSRQLQLTPFVGNRVRCVSADTADLVQTVQAALRRTVRRRQHRVTLDWIRGSPIAAHQRTEPLVGFLERVIQLIPVGVIGLDGQGCVVAWNQAAGEIFGFPETTLMGRAATELFGEIEGAALRQLIAGETGSQSLRVRVTTQRLERDLALEAARVTAPDGQPGTLLLVRDVSAEVAQRAAEQDLAKLQVLIEASGAAAHEINSPLTGVMGSLELLLPTLSTPDQKQLAHTAYEAAKRIAEIVSQMSQIQSYATKPYVSGRRIIDLDRSTSQDHPAAEAPARPARAPGEPDRPAR